MRLATICSLWLLAAVGCAIEPVTDSQEDDVVSCDGATRDAKGYCRYPNGKFAKSTCCATVEEFSCEVVDVHDGLLEESLGSYVDISEDGWLQVDEDATGFDLQFGPAGGAVSIGNYGYSTEDGDKMKRVKTDDYVEYAITPATDDGVYRVRHWPAIGSGYIFHDGEDGSTELATLDCTGRLQKPMAAPVSEKDLRCTIVDFDYSLRDYDGGMGDLYYLDTEYGGCSIDEDNISVYADVDDGSWYVRLGGYSFRQADGDTISLEEVEHEESGPMIVYKIAGADWDDKFEMRVWRKSGMGVVLVSETESEPAGRLAVLDCRGLGYPDTFFGW